jgi:hypothetical protein
MIQDVKEELARKMYKLVGLLGEDIEGYFFGNTEV